jgi:hypothetical protein
MVLGAFTETRYGPQKVLFKHITVLVNPRLPSRGMEQSVAQLKSVVECVAFVNLQVQVPYGDLQVWVMIEGVTLQIEPSPL